MPQHQDALQLLAAGDAGRDPRFRYPVHAQVSGFNSPSKANEAAFNRAVDQVAKAAEDLLASLVTIAPPRDREVEAAKLRARSALRFGVR